MKRPFPISLGIFTLTSLLAVSVGHAASQTWTGGSTGNGSWETTANWTGTAPGITGSSNNADIATFDAAIANGWGTEGTPIVIDAGRKLGGLNFGTNSGSYIIGATGGNALNLAGGGSTQLLSTLTTGANVKINAPLLLLGKYYSLVNYSASGSLAIGGAISSSSASTGNILTLSGSHATTNTISGVISDGSSVLNAGGGMGITVSGAANWTLSGANTFTGTTLIASDATGTLTLTNALALQYSTVNVNIPYSNNGHIALANGLTEVTFGGISGNGGLFNSKITGFSNLTKLTLNTVTGKVATLGTSGYIADNGENMELVKKGAGTQIFQGAQLYTGNTTISDGTLLLSGSGSLASTVINNNATFDVSGVTGGFALKAGQSLKGSGRVIGAVSVGKGTLDIGNSPGTMTFDNDLTMTSDSTAHFEINGFGAGEFDLAAGGAGSQGVTFGGTLNITFQNGFNTLGSVSLFDFETYSGSFSAINFNGLADGFTASFDQQTGKVFVTAAAVPEPTSAVLMLIGLGLGARFLGRRRNS